MAQWHVDDETGGEATGSRTIASGKTTRKACSTSGPHFALWPGGPPAR
jgi:hypothetical protein